MAVGQKHTLPGNAKAHTAVNFAKAPFKRAHADHGKPNHLKARQTVDTWGTTTVALLGGFATEDAATAVNCLKACRVVTESWRNSLRTIPVQPGRHLPAGGRLLHQRLVLLLRRSFAEGSVLEQNQPDQPGRRLRLARRADLCLHDRARLSGPLPERLPPLPGARASLKGWRSAWRGNPATAASKRRPREMRWRRFFSLMWSALWPAASLRH